MKIKLRIIRPLLVLSMIVLTFSAPLMAIAQELAQVDRAVTTAERDAQGDVNKQLWFCVGCFGLIGLVASYVYTPSPPASRFIGKTSGYIQTYTTAYKAKARSIQTSQAVSGCVTGCLVTIGVNVVLYLVSQGDI